MSNHASIPSRLLLGLCALGLGFAFPAAAVANARVSESYGKLPLHFEANQGQAHQDVRFLSRGPGYGLYLTGREAVLVLTQPSANPKRNGRGMPEQLDTPAQAKSVALRMSLVGARAKPIVSGLEELPGKANYFIGRDPSKWRTNVPTYGRVHYREVYPGIDLVYYGNQRSLEYDFVVARGADLRKIALSFKGAERLEIDAQGDLVLHMGGESIRQKKPVIYQEVDGVRQEIAGSYVRKGAKRVGFKVAAYDRSRSLIIDPVLVYSTYLGGSGLEYVVSDIAVDADGNAYVAGGTASTDFPTTTGAFQPVSGGGTDAFVTKLNPTGTALLYSTYLGGSAMDYAGGIAVDADGNAYVTGHTASNNFPTTAGAFQTGLVSSPDRFGGAFVAKLNPGGSALVYSTYLGGSEARGIAVDADGNAYVTGGASTNFPTTTGAFQSTYGGDGGDAFIAKFNSTGSALVYSTYLGGTGTDGGTRIAVDASGSAYVAGGTVSSDFPTTAGAFQPVRPAKFDNNSLAPDAFVAKLDPTGSTLVYSTYLGGMFTTVSGGIAVDTAGNAYVTGTTQGGIIQGNNFPTTPGAFQTTFGGVSDAFVTKLEPAGSALLYSTYLGGNGKDEGFGIAVDAAGNAYVTGRTGSTNFPTTIPVLGGPDSSGNSSFDAFVTKLDPAGSVLVYSTYLGGTSGTAPPFGANDDGGSGIAVDAAGNAYVTGWTSSSDFPTTPGAFQTTFGGGYFDAFVAKIAGVALPLGSTATSSEPSATTRFEESSAAYTGQWTTYGPETGTFSGGTVLASNVIGSTATFSFTGTAVSWIGVRCTACGIATVSIDGGPPATVNTSGPAEPGSLRSEVVFSASGLAPDVNHTLAITVTGTTTSLQALLLNGTNIAVDAFDVTR